MKTTVGRVRKLAPHPVVQRSISRVKESFAHHPLSMIVSFKA